MQKEIIINDVVLPILKEGGETYYPITYLYEKVLTKQAPVTKELNKNYGEYMHKLVIDFSFMNNNSQACNCISKTGLKLLLSNIYVAKLQTDMRILLNGVLEHLGMDLVEIKEYEIFNRTQINKIIQNYDEFTKDSINYYLQDENLENVKWKKCNVCGKWFPLVKYFYLKDSRSHKFNNLCLNCQVGHRMTHPNKYLNLKYIEYGLDVYRYYRDNNVIEIYNHWTKVIKGKSLPTQIQNREAYLLIIRYLYDSKFITKDNINTGLLRNDFNLPYIGTPKVLTMEDACISLFGIDYKYYPWEHPKLQQEKLSFEDGKIILNNYIRGNNVDMSNIFGIDYVKLLENARLGQFTNDTLDFVVKYYDYEHAGYKFKTKGANYYKSEYNRILDMKYLIEKDMKIPIEKIPLYLTKTSLKNNARSLYDLLNKGTYYNNLFEWIDKVYKGKFIDADFSINTYRDEFDSMEESQINDILHNEFENVIYNQRNGNRTISLMGGKVPDWFIFTDNGCSIIEYFGLYVDRTDSSRINDYKERTDDKLEKYKELRGYTFVALYPEDLKNNFSGVMDKIKVIS